MATKTEADEFSYLVPHWVWKQKPHTVLRNARQLARRKRVDASGEPEVLVILRWPQDAAAPAAPAG